MKLSKSLLLPALLISTSVQAAGPVTGLLAGVNRQIVGVNGQLEGLGNLLGLPLPSLPTLPDLGLPLAAPSSATAKAQPNNPALAPLTDLTQPIGAMLESALEPLPGLTEIPNPGLPVVPDPIARVDLSTVGPFIDDLTADLQIDGEGSP